MMPEPRWLDDRASPDVRRLLESAALDEPTDQEFEAMRAKLAPCSL